MEPGSTDTGPSRRARRIGLGLGALACLQLLFSAGVKFVMPTGAPEHFTELGWRPGDVADLAYLELNHGTVKVPHAS